MHEIDASFRRKLSDAREKRQRLLRRRIFGAAGACLVLAVAAASYFVFESMRPHETEIAGDATDPQPEARTQALRRQRHHRSGRRSAHHPPWLVGGTKHQAQGFRRPRRDEAACGARTRCKCCRIRCCRPACASWRCRRAPRISPSSRRKARAPIRCRRLAATTTTDDAAAAAPEEENYEGSDEVLVPVSGQDDLEGDDGRRGSGRRGYAAAGRHRHSGTRRPETPASSARTVPTSAPAGARRSDTARRPCPPSRRRRSKTPPRCRP